MEVGAETEDTDVNILVDVRVDVEWRRGEAWDRVLMDDCHRIVGRKKGCRSK